MIPLFFLNLCILFSSLLPLQQKNDETPTKIIKHALQIHVQIYFDVYCFTYPCSSISSVVSEQVSFSIWIVTITSSFRDSILHGITVFFKKKKKDGKTSYWGMLIEACYLNCCCDFFFFTFYSYKMKKHTTKLQDQFSQFYIYLIDIIPIILKES